MPKRCMPLWVGWAMLPGVLLAAKLSGKEPMFNAGMLRASVSNEIVSHDKAKNELGYTLRPLTESLADALEGFSKLGWLEA